ncbi:hypothetical protein [Roseomonas sp. BN140053]|uniref:hypothetical protein n=1 Tax=Roseomonas sp. BN140053 TaxID=3391898 RepID=UPI0039EB60D9
MTQPPKKMRYDSQAIVYLADDLWGTANTLQRKRVAAGDTENAFDFDLAKSRIFAYTQITALPLEYRQATSRLIILGHGNEASTFIATATQGGRSFTPEQLYAEVKKWLTASGYKTTRVQRVSLHMCYGGGNRGALPIAGSSNRPGDFTVDPRTSFAYKLARICGDLTVDVTARADETNTVSNSSGNVLVSASRHVGGRHHAEGDKWRFVTDAASTPENPVNPKVFASYNTPAGQRFR